MGAAALEHTTIGRPVEVAGPGLFCARVCRVVIRPASAGHGVVFKRVDAEGGGATIAALAGNVRARPRQTVLAASGAGGGVVPVTVQTVEHILSALVGTGCGDVLVEVDGPEIPLADGSSAAFARAILEAGVVPSVGSVGSSARPPSVPIVVTTPIEVAEGDARIVALPSSGPVLDVTYDLDYGPGAPMGPQSGYYRHDYAKPDAAAYAAEIAPARTFATQAEAEQLRASGLFGHLSPGDVVVLGASGPIGTALRFRNEPARHKVLDVIGDLALAGRPIFARINAARSGHALNHRMAQILSTL
ncbi:MAG: UDP-3-O-acyl-N-acetylglucosamine deacetylase [Phycisphaerae bacterium]|nr:UDP-3-O-acyl-N-acetylglucosamine deacetylase [Phycisphaerae bacterium]